MIGHVLPWSQRFFLIFHRMRELRENREAARNTSREAALSQLLHAVKNQENLWDQDRHVFVSSVSYNFVARKMV